MALAPLGALLGFGWFATTYHETALASANSQSDALVEELGDLESETTRLKAELASTRQELQSARAAAATSLPGGVDALIEQVRALPASERAALLADAEHSDDPDLLLARIAALPDPDRATIFDTLSSFAPFHAWMAGLDPAARRVWLRQLPGGEALAAPAPGDSRGEIIDLAEISNRMTRLRQELDDSVREREEAISERDQLLDEIDRQRGDLDEMESELQRYRRPTADALLDRLGALERAERASFFGAATRRGLLFDWFDSATIEEQEVFAAGAPDSMRRALSGGSRPEAAALSEDADLREKLGAAEAEAARLTRALNHARQADPAVETAAYGTLSGEEAGELIAALDAQMLELEQHIHGLETALAQRTAERDALSELIQRKNPDNQ